MPGEDKSAEYPEATMFGTFPAKGFFVRHARDVEMRDIRITTTSDDVRPDVVKVDVE